MRSAILMCGSSAHEVAKAGASSLSKLALSAGVRRGAMGGKDAGLRMGVV